jgi:hypothetical protein
VGEGGGAAHEGCTAEGQRPHTRGCRGRARRGKEGGTRREGKGRKRKREREEKGGEGSSPRGSNSGDHRLQNLGHHGERERWEREREVAAWEKSNERKGPGGGAWAELGRAGLGRARLGRTVSQNPVACTTTDRKSIREAKIQNETKQHTRLSTKSDK